MNQIAFDTQILSQPILPGLSGGGAPKTPATEATAFTNTLTGAIKDVGVGDKNGLPVGSILKVDDNLVDGETLPIVPFEKNAQTADALPLTLDPEVTPEDDDDPAEQLILGDMAILSGTPVSSHIVSDISLDDDLQELDAPILIKPSDSEMLPLDAKNDKTAGTSRSGLNRPLPHNQPPTIIIEAEPIPGDAKVAVSGDIVPSSKVIPATDVDDPKPAFQDKLPPVPQDNAKPVTQDKSQPVPQDNANPVAHDKSQPETDTLNRLVAKGQSPEGESRIPATSTPKTDSLASLVPDQTAKSTAGDPSKLTGAVDTEIVVPGGKNTETLTQDIVTVKPAESEGASKQTKSAHTPPTKIASKPGGPSADRVEYSGTDDIEIEVYRGTVTKTDNAGETLVADAASKIQKPKARTAGKPNAEHIAPQPLASEASVEEPLRLQGSDTAIAGTPEPVAASQTRMTVNSTGTSTDKIAGTEVVSARSISAPPDATAIAARAAEATSIVANRPAESATIEPTPRFVVDLPAPLRIPSQIRVRLDPPELGAVRIDLQAGRNGIVGTLRFLSDRTRSLVERDLGQLQRALHEAGVRVERLEVAGGSAAEFRNSLNSQTTGQQQWSQHSSRGQYQQARPQGNPWQMSSEQSQAPSTAWPTAPETMGIINRGGQRGVNLVA